MRSLLPGALAFAVLWLPQVVYTLGPGGGRLERVGFAGAGAVANHLSFWSPGFWFLTGDPNPRHHLAGTGFAGPAVGLLGLAAAVRWGLMLVRRPRREALAAPFPFFLAWMLLAPLAAALTAEGNPHALRAILLVPGSALLGGMLLSAPLSCPPSRHFRVAGVVALAILCLAGAALTARGLVLLSRGPGAPWEAGTVEAVRHALGKGGTPSLSAEVPYALYVALFAEETPPHDYQERGMAALRTRLLAPGEAPTLHPGDTWITPPRRGLPIHYHTSPVVIYERGAEGAFARLPPGREHLYPEIPGVD